MRTMRTMAVLVVVACGPDGAVTTDPATTTGADSSTGSTAAPDDAGSSGVPTTGGTGDGETSSSGGDVTTSTGETSDESTSTGEVVAGCGDGVAAAGELCFTHVVTGLEGPHALALVDVDGDAHLDLVGVRILPCPLTVDLAIAAQHGPTGARDGAAAFNVFTLFGDGTGQFAAGPSVTPPFDAPSGELFVVDVTGDAVPDVVLVADFETLVVLPGIGDGSFAAAITRPLAPSFVGFTADDLDQDGAIDLIGGSHEGFVVLRGDGVGGFVAQPVVVAGDKSPSGVVVFDVDDDGVRDVIVGRRWNTGGDIEVLRGDADGALTSAQVIVNDGVSNMVVAPAVDTGGAAVFAWFDGDVPGIEFLAIAADGTLAAPQAVGVDRKELVAGQFDGGARRDVMLLGWDVPAVILGDGPWPPETLPVVDPTTEGFNFAIGGDVNEDGIDDVVIAGWGIDLLLSNP